MEKNSLDVIKEMTCKIKEATECLVKEKDATTEAPAEKTEVEETKEPEVNEATAITLDTQLVQEIDISADEVMIKDEDKNLYYPPSQYAKKCEDWAKKNSTSKVTFKLLKKDGPGGGNPLYQISGKAKDLVDWGIKNYDMGGDEEDILYAMGIDVNEPKYKEIAEYAKKAYKK